MTKYSPEIAESIAEAVAQGMPIKYAAEMHFVGRNTLHNWISKRKSFRALIDAKKAEFIKDNLKFLRDARPKNWQAASWLLERRLPEEFALRLPDKGLSGPITINLLLPLGVGMKDSIGQWADKVIDVQTEDVKQITDDAEKNEGNDADNDK
jgi:hypothetical protein